MHRDIETQAAHYHGECPGFVRAALLDVGISVTVAERRQIGWDGRHVTIPVRSRAGRVVFFERWDVSRLGLPIDRNPPVELFGWDVALSPHPRIIFAEGVHEALVCESAGVAAVAATGSGRRINARDWGPTLAGAREVVLAFRRGQRTERRKHLLSRTEVVERLRLTIPGARIVEWPPEVRRGGGAFAFFKKLGRTRSDFERLLL